MDSLDYRTIERLARIVVDADGPYMRTGRQLEALLTRAGWQDPPEYDGTAKVAWLVEQIEDRRDRPGDIERLVCRVCDPLEYDEGPDTAEIFRHAVNDVLEPEGLVVLDTGGRPVIAEVGRTETGSMSAEPRDLEARVRQLVGNQETADLLLKRADEAAICQRHGAYTMAVIAIGSFVEGMLLTMLTERDEDCRNNLFVDDKGKVVRNPKPNLACLIDTAHTRGWIQLDATTFMHNVRNFRNYIHPGRELADNPGFDNDSVGLCWAPIQAMINDLEEKFAV